MSRYDQNTTTQDSSLSEDLLQLYKVFAMFSHFCASFCDTLAGVATENEVIDTETLQGLDRCCRWIKRRMEEFKARLEAIERKSRTGKHSSG